VADDVTDPPGEDQQLRAINLMLPHAQLRPDELWVRFFGLGGAAGPVELEAYVQGLIPLTPLDRDVLAHAVNERLDELGCPGRIPYSRTARGGAPRAGPLAALVELLDGAYLVRPEDLGLLAERAGAALGVGLCVYVADYAQDSLIPLPSAGNTRRPLGIDTTLAGRAFRFVDTVASTGTGRPCLWVPLLDGVERLGVLEVLVRSEADLTDPGLRAQCRWVSALLGHLITAVSGYGDVVDTIRRAGPCGISGELLRCLLPPLTSGVDGFLIAGMIEPGLEAHGDVFDYGLSAATASFAIFDAMGHDLNAAVIAATALATYRSARRRGAGIYEQARAVDETLAATFPDAFCTGVVAELHLRSGRLRYLSAGHPPPMLYRAGKVVRRLEDGRRVPFGLDEAEAHVAEEMLQPGDWLALYTDGVVEARDRSGAEFGDARLADFLIREAAAGHPPPETVRRLTRAVLRHQHGVLQDDATVLLASWNHYAFGDHDRRGDPEDPGPG
jgi:hypothetical protein